VPKPLGSGTVEAASLFDLHVGEYFLPVPDEIGVLVNPAEEGNSTNYQPCEDKTGRDG